MKQLQIGAIILGALSGQVWLIALSLALQYGFSHGWFKGIFEALGIHGRAVLYIEAAVMVALSFAGGGFQLKYISDYIRLAASLVQGTTFVVQNIEQQALDNVQDKIKQLTDESYKTSKQLEEDRKKMNDLYTYMPFEKLDLAVNATAMDPFDMLDMMAYSKTEVTFGGDEYGF
jgi:hypothetical protein